MRVAVIGAGLSGLSTAAHLVGRGHQVTIYERDPRPGGRAGRFESDGFRIDTGPTVLTMPDLVDETFAAMGAERSDYLSFDVLDPIYRAHYADGSQLYVRHGREAMANEIRDQFGAGQAAAFEKFADWLVELYHAEYQPFIDTNFDSVFSLAWPPAALARLVRLGGFRRLAPKVESFFDDPRLQKIFSFQSLYAGVSPQEAMALFAVITYMDSIGGVFTTPGGVHELPVALARALVERGVTIEYNTPVRRVLRDGNGAVAHLELGDDQRIKVDAVVCSVDLPVAYRTLLGGVGRPLVARRGRYSPSAMVWLAGVRGTIPNDAVRHNIHFGSEWEAGFKAIIHQGTKMPDPSLLITMQSSDDPSVAPQGHVAMSALEPTPNLKGKVDWERDSDAYFEQLRQKVAALGYPTDAVTETTINPLDWERMGMQWGTPFSLAHTFSQSGPFRPANTDKRIPGMVFTGSGTIPGVGVPMVLISGKLSAERVHQYAEQTRIVQW